jgi:ribosome biogenesis GTPase
LNLIQLGWHQALGAQAAFAPLAEAGFGVGRIAQEQRQRYQVYTADGELPAEVTGHLRHHTEQLEDFPTVGDWVALQLQGHAAPARIHQRLPRFSQFVRKVAGAQTAGQVVAANVNTLFLMAGLDGDFNLRRMERYLVMAWESGATPVVVLNKADQCEGLDSAVQAVTAIAPGVPIHAISAATGEGLTALNPYLQMGQTIALVGSSGVGKSTLTNRLVQRSQQATQAVRSGDSRGRHTTSHRQLIPLPSGALLIDTPGMRELQLWSAPGQPEDGLHDTFPDIEVWAGQCKFRNCQHQTEPGCAVQAALAAGDISPQRWASYEKLQREQQWLGRRQDSQAAANTKRRWKQITQTIRQQKRDRGRG